MELKSITTAIIQPSDHVFIAADIDVPIKNGVMLETFRLEKLEGTLDFIVGKGAKAIIGGHLGQPDGVTSPDLSTNILLPYFESKYPKDSFILLENLRFDPREEQESQEYAKELIQNYNLNAYVNENFATSHREHTSIVTLPKLLPAYAGLNLLKEIETLDNIRTNPSRPLVAIVGGAKLESKKPVIKKFLEISDQVLVGGKIGEMWDESVANNLHLTKDNIDQKDIGQQTINEFISYIQNAKSIIWAGPMGVYEETKYMNGTKEIAQAIIESGATSIIGGGDTITALDQLNLLNKMSFVSTGGGSMLEYLVDGALPGIEALKQ